MKSAWLRKFPIYVNAIGGGDPLEDIPLNEVEPKWFHDYIYNKAEIRFLKGRLKFGDSKNSAPFPSMIVIFKDLTPLTSKE